MNYEDLIHLPKINGRTLIGDMMFEDLGLVQMTPDGIKELLLEVFGYVV